jgi:putative transposase
MQGAVMRPQKHKTCRRYDVAGDAHFLTFACFHGQQFLSKDRTRQWFVDALEDARRLHAFWIWAYVIMPEHCHLLVVPQQRTYSISKIMSSIKLPVTRRAVAFLRKNNPFGLKAMRDAQPSGEVHHRFWQRGGGFDANMLKETAIYATMEYIHLNPVRRGLAERPECWRWSSAGFYEGAADAPLKMDVDSLPRIIETET